MNENGAPREGNVGGERSRGMIGGEEAVA